MAVTTHFFPVGSLIKLTEPEPDHVAGYRLGIIVEVCLKSTSYPYYMVWTHRANDKTAFRVMAVSFDYGRIDRLA